MKEFVVYTALRIALFAATLGIVIGVWSALGDHVNGLVAVVAAFVVSGVGSWYLLQRPRSAFARKVEVRAERATAAFDALRAKEDAEAAAAADAAARGAGEDGAESEGATLDDGPVGPARGPGGRATDAG